jgi:hypothetical protein
MNISWTAPNSSCFSALSVVWYCLKSSVALMNAARMLAICGPDDASGMIGVGPGLAGGKILKNI